MEEGSPGIEICAEHKQNLQRAITLEVTEQVLGIGILKLIRYIHNNYLGPAIVCSL